MKITEYIKKKPFLYRVFSPLVKVVSSFLYQLSTRIPRFIEMRVLPICRMLGGRKDTQKIKELKDIHKGKRIFIIACGPSLREEDILKLKDEITIGVNGTIALYEKIGWIPTYYNIADPNAYKKYEEKINNAGLKKALLGIHLKKHEKNMTFEPYYYERYLKGALFPLTLKRLKKYMHFSTDIYREGVNCNGLFITTHALQFAAYMGAKEIYLYALDCDYSGSKTHFDDPENSNTETGKTENDIERIVNAEFAFCEKAREYAEANKIKIYNATRGGRLEVFERVDLDTLFE